MVVTLEATCAILPLSLTTVQEQRSEGSVAHSSSATLVKSADRCGFCNAVIVGDGYVSPHGRYCSLQHWADYCAD